MSQSRDAETDHGKPVLHDSIDVNGDIREQIQNMNGRAGDVADPIELCLPKEGGEVELEVIHSQQYRPGSSLGPHYAIVTQEGRVFSLPHDLIVSFDKLSIPREGDILVLRGKSSFIDDADIRR